MSLRRTLVVAVVVASACAREASPPAGPSPSLGPGQSELQLWAICYSGKPEQYLPLACTVTYSWPANATTSIIRSARADLSVLGLSDSWGLVHVPACGGCYDLDLHVPPGAPPGPVQIRFRFEDGLGRVATTQATFTVLPK